MTAADQSELLTLRPTTTEMHRRSSILDLCPESGRKRTFLAGTGALGVHALILGLSLTVGAGVSRDLSAAPTSEIFEVEIPLAEDTPAPPKQPETSDSEDPVPLAPSSADPAPLLNQADDTEEPPSTEEPPPEPALAGQVLTADERMLDLSNTIISGPASHFAGGVTTADGTSRSAVRSANARSGGAQGGTGSTFRKRQRSHLGVKDRARAPRLAGTAEWSCPFPPEADAEQINHASVSLRVEVGPTGQVGKVTVVDDPGYGFGRVAQRCAAGKRWDPGLDRKGDPTGATAHIKVQFRR